MDKIFMVVGCGPNDLQIPLVPFPTKEEAEKFIEQFPQEGKYKGHLADDFSECNPPYTHGGDPDYEHSELGKPLYEALFKDGSYYSGCGGCYRLKILEAEFGKPMVGWDLD